VTTRKTNIHILFGYNENAMVWVSKGFNRDLNNIIEFIEYGE